MGDLETEIGEILAELWTTKAYPIFADRAGKAKTALLKTVDRYVEERERLAQQESDKRIVDIVRNELRHIVEGDEDGAVYSISEIGNRATKRLATLRQQVKKGDVVELKNFPNVPDGTKATIREIKL